MSKDPTAPTRQLTVPPPRASPVAASAGFAVPGIVADADEHAARRFLEFFAATIRNRNTRAAYMTAVSRFLAGCDQHRIGQLADIEPLHVARYIEDLGRHFEKPMVKQHLCATHQIRHGFRLPVAERVRAGPYPIATCRRLTRTRHRYRQLHHHATADRGSPRRHRSSKSSRFPTPPLLPTGANAPNRPSATLPSPV